MENKKKTKLAQYLEDECIQHKGFAKKIGVSHPTLLLLIRGQRQPSLEVAFRIEKATHGHVKATDWLSQDTCEESAKM